MTRQPDLRYPVGEFSRPKAALTTSQRHALIDSIRATPAKLRAAVKGLNERQLDAPYRPDGWTVRQVVHHIADSHLHAYCRFKFALTEDTPAIKPYNEQMWAELIDAKSALVAESLSLLDALHARWVMLLAAMTPDDFLRKLNHPEWDAPLPLDTMLALYEWHGRHHTAHITALRERQGW